MINFEAEPEEIGAMMILRLPETASGELPSRGQVSVTGFINGNEVAMVIEPDGRRGHWMRLDQGLVDSAALEVGAVAKVSLTPGAQWPEPVVPDDLARALGEAPEEIGALWKAITPMARWEWVRWVQATASDKTRARRVEVTISKMSNGKRRPCCFDLSACTDPSVSRSGKLIVAP
ncbi:MAG TPA: YdeI/OmpD-associated family protein [Marmoricola sp.]|nr:YdeI/OmpD-associated family protein [Marmoricola sp.]HRV70003.1 YdeI/OmpD-associated family protein [Marmoricola sp.]